MNLTQHTLSDGTVVEQSDRKSNRSGYTGAALSPSWTLDADKPFIAACSNPTDPEIMSKMRAQARTAWHGGAYSDAREAAYVVAKFREDPVAVESSIINNGAWTNFPADLYSLPEGLAFEKAIEILNSSLAQKKSKKPVVVQLDPSVIARGNLHDFFKRDQLVPISQRLGGAEKFQAAIEGLTISQFAKKFELAF